MPSSPLQDLFRSEKPDLVTHEIILVHGFKSCQGSKSRSTECRRILKSWIASEIKPISNCVNVRVFSFDSAHILHNGAPALHEAAVELSNSLATTKDPKSPLFCSTSNGDCGRSSRAAIFIAHGMGIWVVKESLTISDRVNRIDPTGLFFFDMPEALLVPNPIVSICTRPMISPYLHEFSKTFKVELNQAKLPGLQRNIEEIDVSFVDLAVARYGRCEEIQGQNSEGVTYATRAMCHNIWMSPTPILTFEKDFARQLSDLGLGEELNAAISSRGIYNQRQEPTLLDGIPVITLEPPKAPECPKKSDSTNTSTTTTSPCCYSKKGASSNVEGSPCPCPTKSGPTMPILPSSEPTNNPTCSIEKSSSPDPSTASDSPKSGNSDDGNEAPSSPKSNAVAADMAPNSPTHCSAKEESTGATESPICTEKDGPRTVNESYCTSKKEDIVDTMTSGPHCGMVKGKEKEHLHPLRLSPVKLSNGARPLSENLGDNKGGHDAGGNLLNDHDKIDDEFDFENIITQRNKAAAEDDQEALRSSIQKLEVLKFHQKENFQQDDPRILITQREIVKTSVEYGWWNGTIMKNWEEDHIREMEDLARKAYDGLRQSLGSHHRETMEALALLLALGISTLDVDEFPIADIQAIQNIIRQKRMASHEEMRQPGKLLRTLGLEYKTAHKRIARPEVP